MNEKDIQLLIDIADESIRKMNTPEKALQSLIDAGIMDVNGNYTLPYQEMLAAN